jgi:hypothetical protein
MDPATIAAAVVAIVRPFISGFVKGAQASTESLGEQAGGAIRDLAQRLWHRIHPTLETKPQAAEAVTDVAEHPDDEDSAAALRVQIRKVLEGDPDLARELASSLQEAQQAGIVADVVVYGGVKAESGGVAAGRDVTGGVQTGTSSGRSEERDG